MDLEQRIRDRKTLHRKARSWKRHYRSAASFETFIRDCWPTVIERLGEVEFQHLIAYVWKL
jgi:hypothetical protein